MIEIVSHAYCPPGLDIYARLLSMQAASLAASPPDVWVGYTVCHAPEKYDKTTWAAVQELKDGRRLAGNSRVSFRSLVLSPSMLFRRAIGRNIVLKNIHLDTWAGWCTDVDYLFGDGCLDTVHELAKQNKFTLGYPQMYRINTTHDLGDIAIANAPNIPPDSDFQDRKQRLAIGGLQIIHKDMAVHGYLDETKWVNPVDPASGFRSCRCDRTYRNHMKDVGYKFMLLDIPGLRRIRHNLNGRDVDLAGVHKGKESW